MILECELKFNVTAGMLDEYSCLQPAAILDLFQEIASRHAYILGCGTPFCEQNNYGWIVARQTVDVRPDVKVDDEVIVYTFPHKANRFEYLREYVLKTPEGEIIATGIAIWVLLDFNNQKILAKDVYQAGDYVEPMYLEKPLKVKPKQKGDFVTKYRVTKSDIDTYHHMNNSKYANLVYNYSNALSIASFSISYISQIRLDEEMDIYTYKEDNLIYMSGIKEDTTIFTALVKERN